MILSDIASFPETFFQLWGISKNISPTGYKLLATGFSNIINEDIDLKMSAVTYMNQGLSYQSPSTQGTISVQPNMIVFLMETPVKKKIIISWDEEHLKLENAYPEGKGIHKSIFVYDVNSASLLKEVHEIKTRSGVGFRIASRVETDYSTGQVISEDGSFEYPCKK